MKKIKLIKGFIQRSTGKKTTILDGAKSQLYTLNETASLILQLLKKGENETEIIRKIVNRYNVPASEAEKDFNDFITELKSLKIISK